VISCDAIAPEHLPMIEDLEGYFLGNGFLLAEIARRRIHPYFRR